MNLSPQILVILFLNIAAAGLLLAVEVAARRRGPDGGAALAEGSKTMKSERGGRREPTETPISLDHWIDEVEQAEDTQHAAARSGRDVPRAVKILRQVVAARGRSLPSIPGRA